MSKEKDLDLELESFSEDVSDLLSTKMAKEEGNLSKEETLETVFQVFKKRLKIELKKQKNTYKKKINNLKNKIDDLEVLTEENLDITFQKGWDKLQNIEKISIVLYTIEVKTRRGQCKYCYYFKEYNYVDQLRKLPEILKIDPDKYSFDVIRVDHADRFLNGEISPKYDNNLSTEGLNWFYVNGLGIEWFPAMDIRIRFKPRANRRNRTLLKRKQGMGHLVYYCENCEIQLNEDEFEEIDGERKCLVCRNTISKSIVFGDFINAVLIYLKTQSDKEFSRRLASHQNTSQANDLALDRKYR